MAYGLKACSCHPLTSGWIKSGGTHENNLYKYLKRSENHEKYQNAKLWFTQYSMPWLFDIVEDKWFF